MNYTAIAALAIFAVTIILMIKRPRKIRLGYAAGIGAATSLLLGTVSLNHASQLFIDIWNAALAFIGIVALSVTLDAIGFFRWAALRVVRLAGGSGYRLYFYVALLTAVVSILFANDSAVLILTPIVLEIVTCLGISSNGRLAYLFSAGLIADAAAVPLITINPINILSADFFHYGFLQHLVFMGPIAVATIASSILLVFLFFRKKVPKCYDSASVNELTLGKPIFSKLLKISIATLIAIDIGHVFTSLVGVPVSLVMLRSCFFSICLLDRYSEYQLSGPQKEGVEKSCEGD